MDLKKIPAGKNIPEDINVVIEIPAYAKPVKYEIDKDSGALFVDRFMRTSMVYPCNYGFVPNTLSEDGDPVDVLVITPIPLLAGSVINSRVIGKLNMTDEAGPDAKLLAVPTQKLCPYYDKVFSPDDVDPSLLDSIKHFFESYKDLEPGKWVKLESWEGADAAKQELVESVERFKG